MPLPNHSTKKMPGRKQWFNRRHRKTQHHLQEPMGGLRDQNHASLIRYRLEKKARLEAPQGNTKKTDDEGGGDE